MIINNKYCILDCETGGFSADKHALTEIGFVIINKDLEEVERHSFLIKPYDPKLEYSPQALKVTGLSMDILNSKGLDARAVAESVQEIFSRNSKGVKEKLVLVGHNFQFDYWFMDAFFKRFDLQIGKYTDETFLCTMW
ncbi:3'-5' exonuclease, partial [Candidatus Nomurabacteria bacterium]|nr:3'-5' exonuclease [Candidatus Nomurabacteria bacterium]